MGLLGRGVLSSYGIAVKDSNAWLEWEIKTRTKQKESSLKRQINPDAFYKMFAVS